jgi:serine/threonine-protein kinase
MSLEGDRSAASSGLAMVRLDEYELAAPLGSGATARVFEGKHLRTGRRVAIKMLDTSARGNRELRERLAREAVLLTGVQSPYVSRLLGFGWEADQPFLVLERLSGETLADLLKREARLGVPRLVEWIEQLLIGIRDCHNANVIHRDIKPSNIFLEADPVGTSAPIVKLIDFGVARLNEIAKAGTSLTSTHHLIGSMGYMAPEQLQYAKGVGPAADLYAIGVVIFRCVSGRLPFVGKSFDALHKLKCEAVAPKLSSMPGVVENDLLDAFVARALQRAPEERYGSASEMLQEWWRVAAALDRDQPLVEEGTDVVFDDDEPSNTLVDGLDPTPSATTLPTAAPFLSVSQSTTLTEAELPTDSGENAVAGLVELEKKIADREKAER